ncbi:MAG TPA: FecR domain-containing protein [Novosphingobium sp.]|nr:FecR domain-containing protein [Novosphingobium sp.]
MSAPGPDLAPLTPAEEQRVWQDAAGWVARAHEGGLSAAQQALFLAWLRARPEHAAAADLASQAWATAASASRPPAAPAPAPAPPLAAHRWRPALALALGLVAMVGGGLGWRAGCHSARYATAPGERATHQLADGTRLWLAPGSSLVVEITPLARRVTLAKGEAAFDVAHQWRPFRVRAQGLEAVDQGTLFTVRSRQPGHVQVVLARGAVDVRDRASGALLASLRPGEALNREGTALQVAQVDAEAALGWRSGRLTFERMALGEALARFAEQGAAPVRLADPRLAALPVSGAYDVADMGSFLAGIAIVLPLRIRQDSKGYVIEER